MAAPTDPAKLDDAIEFYLSGKTFPEVRASLGVSGSVLSRELARRGIPARGRRLPLDTRTIVAAYESGESERALSLRYGVSTNVIRTRLLDMGAAIRDQSEAAIERARRMTPEERARQASASHDAVRGKRHSPAQLLNRSASREARGLCDSPGELFLMAELRKRGVDPVPQKAIGKYNVDLAAAPVAMEVLGGGWHYAKRHHAVRTPYILNQGWCLLFIWNHEGQSALSAGAADYVVSYLQEVRRNPALVGEYRVIAGRGQLLAAGRAEDDEFTLVKPPRGA